MVTILHRLLETYRDGRSFGRLLGRSRLHVATPRGLQQLAQQLHLRQIEVHSVQDRISTIIIGFNSPYRHTGFLPLPLETTAERFKGWGYFTETTEMGNGYRSIATYVPRHFVGDTRNPDIREHDSIRISAVYDGTCDISLTDVRFHSLVPHLNDDRIGAVMNSVASLYGWTR